MSKSRNQRKSWLYAMITSVLLLQTPGISFAEETAEFALDQVVVTANRVPTPLAKTGANVDVVTREQIEKRNYENLGELLQDVNGVSVGSVGGYSGAQEVLRLNGDERVSIMIDGRKIGRPEGLANARSTVDLKSIVSLDNIERVEIVKGGASALYGSDAVGGIINIITRKGAKNKTTLNIAAGSWGSRDFSVITQGSEKDISWFVTANKKTQDYTEYKIVKPGPNQGNVTRWPNSQYESRGFTLRLDKSLDDNRSITLNYEHMNDEGGQPTAFIPNSKATHYYNNWALTYNFDHKEAVPGFARIYNNHFNQDFNGTYKSRRQGFQYQTGWQANEQHKIVTGLDFEKGEVISSTTWDGSENYSNKSVTNTAIYLQDIYSIADKWTVTPGIRYDHHNKFGSQTTPKVNVNYNADSNTDIYVSYNRVFNAPNLDDLYTPYIPGDPDPTYGYGATYGNPNLRPEKGYVVSAGVNKKLNDETSVRLNYFNSKINDAIDWYPINGDLDDQFADWSVLNIDQQKKHGFEIDIHHKFSDKYYTDLGYSYIHVENTLTIAPLTNSQPNGYRVKIGYNDNQWNWNLNGQSATGRDTTRYVDSGYWVWNLSSSYKMTQDTNIYFNVYNLGNKAYEIVSGGSGGKYPMPARHFQLGVKYSF